MLRALVLVALASSIAHADLKPCAEKAIAAVPDDKVRAELTARLAGIPRAPDFDEAEQRALAQTYDPVGYLGRLLDTVVAAGDTKRALHLVELMEATAAKKPPTYDHDKLALELELARANALVGRAKQARAHVAAVEGKLAKPGDAYAGTDHRDLLIVALTLKDEAFAKAEEATMLDAVEKSTKHGSSDLGVEARFIAYAGFGRRTLPYADRAPQEHDQILTMVLEGVKANKDLPLELEIVGKLTSARARMLELEQVWIELDAQTRRSPAFLDAVKAAYAVESKPEVDDFARGELVEVLADVGLVKEAGAVAGRIKNTWARAHAEARTAAGLALVDRKAAVALARKALDRAKTPGWRTRVDNDTMEISSAKSEAAIAFARAGELAEARKLGTPWVIDIAIGLRDRPAELAAWWKTAAPAERARVLAEAVHGDPALGEVSFLDAVCR